MNTRGLRHTLEERFLEKVHHEPNTGCWLWSGCMSGARQRQPMLGDVRAGVWGARSARTVAAKLEGVPRVLGCCPVSEFCVNPTHFRRAAVPSGEASRSAVLTDAQTRVALRMLGAGASVKVIATHFGCSRALVYSLLHGTKWSPIPRPPEVLERSERTHGRGKPYSKRRRGRHHQHAGGK